MGHINGLGEITVDWSRVRHMTIKLIILTRKLHRPLGHHLVQCQQQIETKFESTLLKQPLELVERQDDLYRREPIITD